MKSRENRKKYWQDHLQAFRSSGLTQREYCRRANISYWSFNPWKRRLESKDESHSLTEVKFKPDKLEAPSDNKDKKIEINLNNSMRISFPVEISPEVLIYIIKSLGDTSCI